MASQVPVVRQVAWAALIYQFGLLALFVWLYRLAGFNDPVTAGGLSLIALIVVLRIAFTGLHRKGMRHVRKMEYAEAIPYFEMSYEYFSRHRNLDKYRAYLLMSASMLCYKEMALNNIGFCYSQLDHKAEAIHYYKRCLEEYPNCTIAQVALKMLEA